MRKYRVVMEECKLFVISSMTDYIKQKGAGKQIGNDPTPWTGSYLLFKWEPMRKISCLLTQKGSVGYFIT